MSLFSKKVIFTSNRHSKKGMMALILGLISLISFFFAAVITIGDKAGSATRMGGVGFVAMIISIASVVTGVVAVQERDVFPILPRAGVIICILSFRIWGGVIYFGAVGI